MKRLALLAFLIPSIALASPPSVWDAVTNEMAQQLSLSLHPGMSQLDTMYVLGIPSSSSLQTCQDYAPCETWYYPIGDNTLKVTFGLFPANPNLYLVTGWSVAQQ